MTQDAMKRKYLGGFCTLAVVNSILFDDTIPTNHKVKALEIAHKAAITDGRKHVWWTDWEDALKQVEKG